jgi:hypothetical protein
MPLRCRVSNQSTFNKERKARIMMLATMSSLLGSVWFGVMLALGGYIAGHIIPMQRVAGWFSRK